MDTPIKILDYGRLWVSPFNLNKTHSIIEEEINKVKKFNKPILVIGGDHSISYGCMKNFDCQILMFDAHPDLVNDDTINHASFLREFKDRATLFGTRYKTKQEEKSIKELKEKKSDEVYISIDVDILDPRIMPGVSHPVNNGWDLEKLKEELNLVFRTRKVVCLDIVEFCPLIEEKKSLSVIKEILKFIIPKLKEG